MFRCSFVNNTVPLKFVCSLWLCSFLFIGCSGGGGSVAGNGSGDNGAGGGGSSLGTATPVITPGAGGGSGGGGSDVPQPGNAPGDPTGDGAGEGGGGGGGGSGGEDASVSIDPGETNGGSSTRDSGSFSGASDSSGIGNLALTLANTVSFQIVSQTATSSQYIISLELLDPASGVRLDADANSPPFTTALSADTLINALPYPTSEADEVVVSGTYSHQIGIAQLSNGSLAGVSADFGGVVVAKNDPNLNSGRINVNVFYFGNEAQKGSNRTAVATALNIWRDIYSASRAITLDIQEFDVSGSGVLPLPPIGSTFYLDNITASGVPADAVNVFIGEDISSDGTTVPGSPLGAFGVAPAIPGAAIPTTKSAVAVSLVEHQGGDGAFTNEEVDILGETFAHEVGHYLGLFHPVEFSFSSGGFVEGDRLTDTVTCSSSADCVSKGTAANNMFPTPVTGVVQRTMTSQQRGVMNLQVLVD